MPAKISKSSAERNQPCIAWSCAQLETLQFSLKNPEPETVLATPWSYVARFNTTAGYIYLKQTPALLALEADIIHCLEQQFNAQVPKIIAQNSELHCFLMQDAGMNLRSILKHTFDANVLCRAINQFTRMQRSVENNLQPLLDIGVPDWRLDKLPALYLDLLEQRELLIQDGLSETEIDQLESLLPTVAALCEKLSAYGIKESLVQPDFNDNNTLVDPKSQTLTTIDLGEIVISYPFFSLINCLQQAKKHHALTDDDKEYQLLLDACFENYLSYASKQHLLQAFNIARRLQLIYAALCSHRLMMACNEASFTGSFQNQGSPSRPLKEFIKSCVNTNHNNR